MTDTQIFNADDLESTGNRFKTLATMEREGEYKAARVAHTPGPWREMEISPGEWFIFANHPKVGEVSHAEIRSGCDEASELGDMSANARLIAAAPQLLEALECMIVGACAVAVPHAGERQVLTDAVALAREAIAAATGDA